MRSMWAAAAAVLLWAGPAWAWEWSDLRAALPRDASWSAAREAPGTAEGIEVRLPAARIAVARWTRAGDADVLEGVRAEEPGGGWTEVARIRMEGLDLPALLRALDAPGLDLPALLGAGVHRGIQVSGVRSSAGAAIERLESFGLDARGFWGGMRLEGLAGQEGAERISLGLAELRGLDVAGILADPEAAAVGAFGLVSVRVERFAAALEGVSGRLERLAMAVGRTEGRWTRLETEVTGLVLDLPRDAPPPVRALMGDLRELRLDRRRLQAETAPGRWQDDSEATLAGLVALRWRLEADAPEGFGVFEEISLRALRLEVEDLGAGPRLRSAFPAEAERLRRGGGELGAMLRALGVPAPAAAEMAEAVSGLLAGGARAAWIEGRVEAPLPLGRLLEGGPDAAAAHVASWTWRAGRRP